MTAIDPTRLANLRAGQATQEVFSGRIRISVARISQAETGKDIPERCAKAYAQGLKRPVEGLFRYVVKLPDEQFSPRGGIANEFGENQEKTKTCLLTLTEAEEKVLSTETLYEYTGGR